PAPLRAPRAGHGPGAPGAEPAGTAEPGDGAGRGGGRPPGGPYGLGGPGGDEGEPCTESERAAKVRAEIGAVDRPLLLAVAPLDRHQGLRTALTAARAWRSLEPPPLLAVAGEGPARPALQARVDVEELPVRLLGRRDDALELLEVADLAVVTGRWPGPSPLAQAALASGVPLVATPGDGLADLVGGAADLVPYGDAEALAAAVCGLLADPERHAALAAAGRAQAAMLPTEEDTVAHVLRVYDELLSR
ncbi:glycosyltransferase family 4 protein, partial [Streptomyces sp. JJ36]|uniref:glycosyltransferase family 4 protein n=1 Tax=Streptomyces sp. JJ36 TaxID=2736645 RepID=UPI001F32F5E9